MAVNRFAEMFAESAPKTASQPSAGIPAGFALCPVFIIQFQTLPQLSQIQDIYRQAYEQAQAMARRSSLEKRFFSVWN